MRRWFYALDKVSPCHIPLYYWGGVGTASPPPHPHQKCKVRQNHVLGFILFVALLVGCGGGGAPAGTTSQQTIDGLTIALERPQQIAVLRDYEYLVTLTDAAGKPVEGATVYLEQDMPA